MKTIFALIFTTVSILAATSASAQTPYPQYWDPGATATATAGGSGNWDLTDSFWYNGASDVPWTNGNDAYFEGTAGTVTLTTSITAGDLYFTNVTGIYSITNDGNGESLTVNTTIDTGGSEVTNAVPLDNSTTLNINGNGRLHLVTGNDLNTIMLNQGTLVMENTNAAIGGSTYVANGAALEVNGTTNNFLNGVEGVDDYLTINGNGINNGGSLRSMSGINEWLERITLAGNSTIYVNTNSAFLYSGADSGTPITDNGGIYNLSIIGQFGNVQFVGNFGLNILGSLTVGTNSGCYFNVVAEASTYSNSIVELGATLSAHADAALGSAPATLMQTNIVLDGGILNGYGTGNWSMNANRGITITTNGGTIENTDNGSDTFSTGSIYDPSNAPLTIAPVGAATISIAPGAVAGGLTNVMNLGTATLTINGGNCKLTGAGQNQYTFSNLVLNGDTYSFNYDSSPPTSPGLGTVPNTVSQSNIFMSASAQLHVGHTTTLAATRGIYLANGTSVIEDVTGGGVATINGPISGPGALNCPLGKSASTTGVTLAGANSYTGLTTVGASATVTISGGAGTLGTGNTSDNGTLTFARSGTYTYGGAISGSGVVNNTGSGTVTLTGASTYTGATTISAGTLLMNNTNASAITVASGGTLGGTGPFGGTISVSSGGTLALGTGTLYSSNNMTLSGNVSVSVNNSGPSSGEANVTGTLTGTSTGKIVVSNVGPALTTGNTFQIFSAPVSGGSSMTISGGGVAWNNSLAANGTISVAGPLPVPRFLGTTSLGGTNLVLSVTNGYTGGGYYVLSTTNLLLPLSSWTPVLTNTFAGSATFYITNPIVAGSRDKFYTIKLQ